MPRLHIALAVQSIHRSARNINMPASNGALSLPAIAPGENTSLNAGAIAPILATYATNRTFTRWVWSTAAYLTSDQIPMAQIEKDRLVAHTHAVLNWWSGEFDRYNLNVAAGLPDGRLLYNNLFQEFRSPSRDMASIPAGACVSSGAIIADIDTFAPANWRTVNSEALNLWVFSRTARTVTVAATFATIALAEAAPAWEWKSIIEVDGIIYEQYAYASLKFHHASGAPTDQWRIDGWRNLGRRVANYAAAIALPAQPSQTTLFIEGFGQYRNETGAAAVFSLETWEPVDVRGLGFTACGGGSIARTSVSPERAGSNPASLALHEVGHCLNLGHSGRTGGKRSPMTASGHTFADYQATLFECIKAYLSRSGIGLSDRPSDYIDPIWIVGALTIGPSSDGSGWPVISGQISSGNQADVPLLAVYAWVDHFDNTPPFDDYYDRNIPATRINSDGTFRLTLDHFQLTGDYGLTKLRAVNVANKEYEFNLTTLMTTWTKT